VRRAPPRLSYANLVATLALFLALGGGAVWAAGKITSNQIGKGQVKTKNLAKKAVKTKNLGGNAVTAAKLKKNAVNFNKLAAGTNVLASATAGPAPANKEEFLDLPLSKPVTVTPTENQPLLVNIEARATLKQPGPENCMVFVVPLINGVPALISAELLFLAAPDNPPNPIIPNGILVSDLMQPIGLTQPGKAQTVTLKYEGDKDCTADSQIDQVAVVVTRQK
jgi:hypothetical protein